MHDPQKHNGSSAGDEPLVRAARGEADALLAAVMTSTVSSAEGPRAGAFDSGSLPGYELLGEVHRGGQGVVYQAIHKTTKRKVAVKVMREGLLASPREKARFDRELEILGRLSHPNIVTIHDSGALGGNAYFVMDYIAGQPLDAHGLPLVTEPVTVTLKPSREAALQVPEVDAYLAFEMSAPVPLSLRSTDKAEEPDAQ